MQGDVGSRETFAKKAEEKGDFALHEKISPWNSIIHIGFIRKRVFLLSSCYDKME